MQSFYCPRSHPGCRAVTVQCLDPGTVEHIDIKKVDGVNWEETFAQTQADQQRAAHGRPA